MHDIRTPAPRISQLAGVFAVCCACVISVGIFFRIQLKTGFGIVFGDRSDGLIEITILEHWWNVARGLSDFRTTFFFYPVRGTLGYNDGYFFYGLIYSAFRAVRIDQFLASDLTNMTLKVVSFIATYLLLTRVAGLYKALGLLGGALFVVASSSYANAYHAQLLSVSLAPLLAVLVFAMADSARQGLRSATMLWGAAAALLYDGWLLTSFYMAWFATYFAVLLLALTVLQFRAHHWRVVAAICRQTWMSFCGIVLVGLVGLIPFAMVYAPTASETGMHPFSTIRVFLPSLLDLFNVGTGNLVYGWLDSRLANKLGADFPASGEHVMGITPVLIAMAVIGSVWNGRRAGLVARPMPTLGAATLLSWLLTVHIGHFDIWHVFYAYFPGAKAVRVISRYELFIALPVLVLAMNMLARLVRSDGPRLAVRVGVATFLGVLILVEQFNSSWPLGLQRAQELGRLAALQPVPTSCAAFYVLNTRPGEPLGTQDTDEIYSHNVDAMFIAESIGVPTLNGMASFIPRGWSLVRPKSPDYLDSVRAFVEHYHVASGTLCSLDLGTGRWVAPAALSRTLH